MCINQTDIGACMSLLSFFNFAFFYCLVKFWFCNFCFFKMYNATSELKEDIKVNDNFDSNRQQSIRRITSDNPICFNVLNNPQAINYIDIDDQSYHLSGSGNGQYQRY